MKGSGLVSFLPDVFACQLESALSCIDGFGEVLAHYTGCEAWPGGEITCVYGLVPGINNGAKEGPMQELYQGGQCVHVVRDFY